MDGRPASEDGSAPASAGHRIRLALFVALLALMPYANALRAGFTFDDHPQILENAAVTQGVDLLAILTSTLEPGNLYRPFTVWTFALDQQLTPAAPTIFHAVNVALHAVVTVLVFALARRLFRSDTVAATAAALFAVHPIHTEAVTSLVGRAELLAAAFGLLAVLTAMPAVDESGAWRVLRQAVSLVSFGVAVLSKESALTLLPIIFLFRITCDGTPWGRALLRELRSADWIPYALCAGVFLWLRFSVVGAVTPPVPVTPLNNILAFVPWDVRVPSAIAILFDYFGLLTFPLVLSTDYSYDQVPLIHSWLDMRFLGGVALIGAAAVVMGRHRHPGVRFAAAFPVAAMAVTANVLFPIGTIKAERLLYLPSVGWVLLVAYGFERLRHTVRYRAPATIGVAIIIAAFALRTWERNRDWQDDLDVYSSAVRTAPHSGKAWFNLGAFSQRRGLHDAAIAHFQRALAIYPSPEVAYGLGYSLEKTGRLDDAVRWYEMALAAAPGFTRADLKLCRLLLDHRRFDEAERACRHGLRYAPADTGLLKTLGFTLIGAGEKDKGTELLHRVMVARGGDQDVAAYLAGTMNRSGDGAGAPLPP